MLQAEKHLSQFHEEFLIVPIPREIGTDCGMCIMCTPEKADRIIKSFTQAGITYDSMYTLKKHKPGFFGSLFKKP